MSKKPKKQNYKPTEAEKANASVALMRHNRFKATFDPLLRDMRDKSLSDDKVKSLRARANADVQQALTGEMSLSNTTRVDAASDMAKASQSQLAAATSTGKQIQNKMQTNVLGIAQGQEADAATGMAKASRMATTEALTRAKAKADESNAKMAAIGTLAGAAAAKVAANKNTVDYAVDADGKIKTDPVTGEKKLIRGTLFTPAYRREGSLGKARGY